MWEDGRARALVFHESSGAGDLFEVRLKDQAEPMLGSFERNNNALVFTPVVPLTAG